MEEGEEMDITNMQADEVQQIMDASAEAYNKEIEKVMKEFDLVPFAAMDVVYLRTRSRWTPELEKRLIQEHREGKKINICDWPPD